MLGSRKPIVIVQDDPIYSLLQRRKQANKKESRARPIALDDSKKLIPHLRPVQVLDTLEPVSQDSILGYVLTGFFIIDKKLFLKLKRAPRPLRRFLSAVRPSISALKMYESSDISAKRTSLLRLCYQFESSNSFGHMIPSAFFQGQKSLGFALPEMYIACGAYGATFTGLVLNPNQERVIMKIAWDDADYLESFHEEGCLKMTTLTGIKSFDRSVVREAMVTRLLSRVAYESKVPFFSLYCIFSYLPIGINNVLVETAFGSQEFVPWTKSDRQSYPSVLKTFNSKDSFFLPQAPPPKHLQASVTLTEMSYETVNSMLQRGACAEWTLDALKDFVRQVALGILCYQKTLALEHGDLHMSNLMLIPNESEESIVLYDSENAWYVGGDLKMFVRFIDWGFARSDRMFGEGDIRTCISIESEKRLFLTENLLFPCEFHDMACLLSELRVNSAKFGDTKRANEWLNSTWQSLCQAAQEWMGWSSMREGTRRIALSGLYPFSMSVITGAGMRKWIYTMFPTDVKEPERKPMAFLQIPQDSIDFAPVPKGTGLATVLSRVITHEPMLLPTDAPKRHAEIMDQLVKEAYKHMEFASIENEVLEKEAMLEFFEVQVFSYNEKRALNVAKIRDTWQSIKETKPVERTVRLFMSEHEWNESKQLRSFCNLLDSSEPESDQESFESFESFSSDLSYEE